MKKGIALLICFLALTAVLRADVGWLIRYDRLVFNGDRDDSLFYLVVRKAGAAEETLFVGDTLGYNRWLTHVYMGDSAFVYDPDSGTIGINHDAPSSSYPLDVGGNIRGGTRDGGASESFGMSMKHVTGAEEDVMLFGGVSATAGAGSNTLWLGGGSASFNSITDMEFYIGTTAITTTGTKKAEIDKDSTTFKDDVVIDSSLTVNAWVSILDSLFIPQFNGGLPATPSSGFFGVDTANDSIIAMLGGTRAVIYPSSGGGDVYADSANVFTATQKIQFDAAAAETGLVVIIDTAGTDRDAHGVSVSGESFDDANDYAYEYKNKDGAYRFYVKGDGYTWCYNNMATAGTFTAGNFIAGTYIYGTKFTAPTNQDLIVAHGETDEFTLFGTENPTGGIYFIAHGDALSDTSGTFMHLDSLDLRLSGLSLTGSSLIRGSDAFGASKTADTVVISGATATDYYWVTAETSAPAGYWYVVAKTDTLIVNSSAAESSTPYNWLRMK